MWFRNERDHVCLESSVKALAIERWQYFDRKKTSRKDILGRVRGRINVQR